MRKMKLGKATGAGSISVELLEALETFRSHSKTMELIRSQHYSTK